MNLSELKNTASRQMAGDKGLLAMDESTPTSDKRFKPLGIPTTEEYRQIPRTYCDYAQAGRMHKRGNLI